MRICTVETRKYELDIRRLLGRRLKRRGVNDMLVDSPERREVSARIFGADMAPWCESIAELLHYDLMHMEVAVMTDALPIPLEDKRAILPEALRLARRCGSTEDTALALEEHFFSLDRLNLEGFLRFRMRDTVASWEMSVVRATQEHLIRNEYLEFMSVLSLFVRMRPAGASEVRVVLNPDGSCTLTDESNARIDCESCTDDGVIGVLVGLAPARITVYDFSGGRGKLLSEVLVRVFEDRVRIF